MGTSPKPQDSGDRSQEFYLDSATKIKRFDQFLSRHSLSEVASGLCRALIRLFNDKGINEAYPALGNCPELEDCYQIKIRDTVCSKFKDSIELVTSESTQFFEGFLFDVSQCLLCLEFSQNKEYPCTCPKHQKRVPQFEEKLNKKISECFEGELSFHSWLNEKGIKLKAREQHLYRRMQFLISNLLPVFKSLMQFVVFYLVNTKLNSILQKGGKALEMKTKFLGETEWDPNLKLITCRLAKKVLNLQPELLKIKGKLSDLQDRVQSLVVEHFQAAMGQLPDDPPRVSMLEKSVTNDPPRVSMLEKSVTSVVSISNSLGSGSGFVWYSGCHIVTNYHVIAGDFNLKVTFHDNSTPKVAAIRYDEYKDIAVLRVHKEKVRWRHLRPGDPSKLKCGDKVYAIGNPFGAYPGSCTNGIISALGRDFWPNFSVWPIQDAIQTDATINPGNSGGPLLNSEGKLIGMNTARRTDFEAPCGIAFAISIDTLAHIVPQLLSEDHEVKRGFLGIWCEPELSVEVEVDGSAKKGVPFTDAPKKGPAGRKGLRPTTYNLDRTLLKLGDIITSVKRGTSEVWEKVTTGLDLFKILDKCKFDEQITLEIFHGHMEKKTSDHSNRRKCGRMSKEIPIKLESRSKEEIPIKLKSRSKVEEKPGEFVANYI